MMRQQAQEIIALVVELADKEAEQREEGTGEGEGEPPAKRPRSASPGAVHPIFAQAGNKKEAATTAKFRSLGLFKTGGGVAQGPSLEKSARDELKTL